MTPDLCQQLTDKPLLTGSTLIPELFAMIADEKEATPLLSVPGTQDAITFITARPTDLSPGAAAP